MRLTKPLAYLCLQKQKIGKILMKLQSCLELLDKIGRTLTKKEILEGDQVQKFLSDLMLINLFLLMELQQSMIGKDTFPLMKCHSLLILRKDIFQTEIIKLLVTNILIIYPDIGLILVELLKLIGD